MLGSMIVVNLKFYAPELDYLDVAYSASDKVAIFGGNFGIFAEITGVSALGILNLWILIMKLSSAKMFTMFAKLFSKCERNHKTNPVKVKPQPQPQTQPKTQPQIQPQTEPQI